MSLLLALQSSGHPVVGAGGIASAEAFGQPTVTFRAVVVGAGAVASAEAIGQPAVSTRTAVAGAGAVAGAEAFGQPAVTFRGAIVGAGAIASAEAIGQPIVSFVGGQTLAPGGPRRRRRTPRFMGMAPLLILPPHGVAAAGGIASAEAFGVPRVEWQRNVRQRREEERLAT